MLEIGLFKLRCCVVKYEIESQFGVVVFLYVYYKQRCVTVKRVFYTIHTFTYIKKHLFVSHFRISEWTGCSDLPALLTAAPLSSCMINARAACKQAGKRRGGRAVGGGGGVWLL